MGRRRDVLQAILQSVLACALPAIAFSDVSYTLRNEEAGIPPQCYTKTEGRYNPCYVCHQNEKQGRPNWVNDGNLQTEYAFSDVALKNHWENLFEDRSKSAAGISAEEIESWIGQDNYSALASALRQDDYPGFIPDLEALAAGPDAFDSTGVALDGSRWVAFNFKPFPSTFWPTNGSFGDLMIRLPRKFASLADGTLLVDVYMANLAMLEATIKGEAEMSVPPVDESLIGIDLDGDGELSTARIVRKRKHYLGGAQSVEVVGYLFPRGTEFLHTVRYLAIDQDGSVIPSSRMKEVRYMKKVQYFSPRQLTWMYQEERAEKDSGAIPVYPKRREQSVYNKLGWVIDDFIEDAEGNLRPTSYEEKVFCMGCHSGIGSTIDSTFSFARKVAGASGWGYVDLSGMPDAPSVGEGVGEYALYIERVGGGSEFRNNDEFREKWISDGEPRRKEMSRADVYSLIVPSRARADQLNRASMILVREQRFVLGRDATLTVPKNVYRSIPSDPPSLRNAIDYDIRLDWPEGRTGGATSSDR